MIASKKQSERKTFLVTEEGEYLEIGETFKMPYSDQTYIVNATKVGQDPITCGQRCSLDPWCRGAKGIVPECQSFKRIDKTDVYFTELN